MGLNLTWEVRDGIINHSKERTDILSKGRGEASTLEGKICQLADAVAYINHDIVDAIRANILTEGDLPISAVKALGLTHSQRVNTMVCDIIQSSWAASGHEDEDEPVIEMSPPILEATNNLRSFLFKRVYEEKDRGTPHTREVIRLLYQYFTEHEDKLPPEYRAHSDEVERGVVDYIAGMTDHYAQRTAEELALLKGKAKQGEMF